MKALALGLIAVLAAFVGLVRVGIRRDAARRKREELAADARRTAEEHRIRRLQETKGRVRLRVWQITKGGKPAA